MAMPGIMWTPIPTCPSQLYPHTDTHPTAGAALEEARAFVNAPRKMVSVPLELARAIYYQMLLLRGALTGAVTDETSGTTRSRIASLPSTSTGGNYLRHLTNTSIRHANGSTRSQRGRPSLPTSSSTNARPCSLLSDGKT
jgi:hypothetical protein